MRLSGSRTYYRPTPPKMPSGLVELIEGLTKEVLKNNPTDIYGFCAGYVHQLLEIRDGPIHGKSLTLEEKIARAQEKVRQRAEKRRLNFQLHLKQTRKPTETNAISNEVNLSSLSQGASTFDNIDIPIQHEQELSEKEVSLARENHTQSRDPQLENIDSKQLKDNDNHDVNNEAVVANHVSKSNSNPVGLIDQERDVIIGKDERSDVPADQCDVQGLDTLDNKISPDRRLLTLNSDPVPHVQTTHDENLLLEEVKNNETEEKSSSSPPNSLLVNQDGVVIGLGDIIIEDISQLGQLKMANLNGKSSLTQTNDITSNDVIQSQTDVVNIISIKEETEIKPVNDNTPNIQQYNEYAELSTENIVYKNDRDMKNKTIHISFKESPNKELENSIDNSNTLESLLEITTDGDILTLHTPQESNNDECISFRNDSSNSEEFKNTKYLNKIDTIDVSENCVVNNNNEKISNSENATVINLRDGSQNSQDNSNIMDLETAAVTIQKVFRTFLFKSRASTFDEVTDEAIFLNAADKSTDDRNFANEGSLNERRPHGGLIRMDTVLQTVNEEKSLSLSTDDSSTLSSAATVIQAHVRGFLVRNKLNPNKTLSNSSLAASHSYEPSVTSLEMDNDQNKNKTVLNIHIVSDGGNCLSRDLITSMDLPLDSSPPSSINFHPLGYDKSERRKQLKREDAIQSISPPSNNSGKLSEEVDSIKELPLNDQDVKNDLQEGISEDNLESANAENITVGTIVDSNEVSVDVTDSRSSTHPKKESISKMSSDEMDVVTPFTSNDDNNSSGIKLLHSGEFHDAVLPTKVTRGDTSVASGE